MKSLEELKAIRDKMQNQVNLRDEDTTATRIVVGMATCGIAAGARPVLTAFSDLAQQKGMKNVVVTQTGCVGLCQYEPIVEILEPGKEYQRDDGSVGVSYNVRKVFDISQTRAAQRPAPAVVRDERLLLKALMNNAPCRFAISNELPESINVAYHPQEHTVYIRQGLDAPTIFRGLAQELARAHMDRDGITCDSPDFTAYSVSYMLCRRNGVPVEGFSFERLPESYAGMDTRALRAEVGIMRDVAGSITADMNRLFAAQEKAQKNRDDEAR